MGMNTDGTVSVGLDATALEAGLKSAHAAVQDSMGKMKASLNGIGDVFKDVQGKFLAFTAVMAGGAAFKQFIGTATDVTKEAVGLGKALGISATDASVWSVAMARVGVSADQVKAATSKIAQGILKNEGSFKSLGVATRESDGSLRNSADIMLDVNEKLLKFKEGTNRNAEGIKIYGKAWGDVQGTLKLSRDLMKESEARAAALGLVVGQENVDALAKYRRNMADSNEVVKAFGNVIGQALLPEFNKMGGWLSDAGPVAVQGMRAVMDALMASWQAIKDTIAAVVGPMVDGIKWLGQTISGTMGGEAPTAMEVFRNVLRIVEVAFIGFRTGVQEVMAIVKLELTAAGNWLKTFALVADRALHLDMAGAKAAWKAGVDENVKIVKAGIKEIVDVATKGAADMNKALLDPIGAAPKTTATKLNKSGKGSDGKDPAAAKENLVSGWQAALEKIKMEQGQAALDEGHYYEMSKAQEKAYWDAKIALTAAGSKERTSVEQKSYALGVAIQKDKFDAEIASYKTGEEAAGHALQAKLAYANAELAKTVDMYQGQGKAVEEARAHVIKVGREIAAQKLALSNEVAGRERANRAAHLDQLQQDATYQEQLGLITKAQLLQMEQKFAADRVKIEADAVQAEIEMVKGTTKDPVALEKLESKLQEIRAKYSLQAGQLSKSLSLEQQKPMMALAQTMEQSFGAAINGMILKTMTLKQAMGSIFKSIFATFMDEMVAKPLAGMAARMFKETALYKALSAFKITTLLGEKTAEAGADAATLAGNTVLAQSAAGLAATNAMASVAAIPVVGWAMAPGVGATTYGIAEGFAAMASASGGYDIPAGINPMTQLHQEEMVLPAHLANAVRSMAAGGGAGQGDVHFHAHGLVDKAGVETFFKTHGPVLAREMRRQARNFAPTNA